MILKEMMLDSLQCMALPVQGAVPAAAEKENGSRQVFGEILSSTVKAKEKSDITPAKSSTQSKTKTTGETPDDKPAVKTFRDVQNEIRYEARKSEVKAKGVTVDDPSAEDTASVDGSEKEISSGELEKVINCFAQALGLNPGEFRQLLKAVGVAPEELANVTDVRQLASKLSEVLELNPDQSKTLGDLLELAKAQVQAAVGVGALKNQTVETKSGSVSVETGNHVKSTKDAPEIEVVRVQNKPDTDFSALMVKMKLKLDELQGRLNSNDGMVEEISLKLQAILKEKDATPDIKAEIQTAANDDGIEAPVLEKAAVKNDDRQGLTDSKEGKSESKTEDSGIKPSIAAVPAGNDDQSQVAVPITAQVQKVGETSRVDKLDVRTPVQAREIINQVLEKAKVILAGDKSEMVMDLKPDSLGKLSLKVVTEHGMIMAKFVAENQQVKQVLETNMQLLKDSLEKQGMNVQGFSVSVRQDSQQGYRSQNENGPQARMALNRTALSTEKLMTSAERLATIERRNPYSWGTSTVNFTA